MRDNFNMIPIVQDNHMTTMTNNISNGYYGYQPPPLIQNKEMPHFEAHSDNAMEVQYPQPPPNNRNRKRCWDYCSNDDIWELKKRRQNESRTLSNNTQPINRDVALRTPTHNVPDMPRCLMGHYI